MRKIKFFDKTKIKALILSGVTLLSGISCGKTSKEQTQPDASMIMETLTTSKYKDIKPVPTTTTTVLDEYNIQFEDNYVEPIEEIEIEEPEEIIEDQTEAKTENQTEAKKQEESAPIIDMHKVQGSPSISTKNNNVVTTIKNKDIKITTTKAEPQTTTSKKTTTTKSTTTTTKATTTTTTTTTEPVTEPPRTEYNKYDLLDPNPAVAAMAFEKLSGELRDEMYGNCFVRGSWGVSNGADQARVVLATLNYNQGIAPEVLASDEALGKLSKEEIVEYSVESDLVSRQYLYNRIDINKYVLDQEFVNELNNMTDLYYAWYNNDDMTIHNKLREYFANENFSHLENVQNSLKFYLWTVLGERLGGYDPTDIAKQYFNDTIATPMYQGYEQFKGHSYTK